MTDRNLDGGIPILWGDGEHRWRLRIRDLREIESTLDLGIYQLHERIARQQWRVRDLETIVRLALIGGGMEAPAATRMIAAEMDRWPLLETAAACQAVVLLALTGPQRQHTGQDQDDEGATAGPQTADDTAAASMSPASTPPVQPSDGHPDRSTS